MAYKIETIEGIGPAFATKLAGSNIKTTEDLLKLCCEAKGRKTISESTGVSEKLLLKWANMADLMRIPGIGGEFAELLEAAGVDTIKELRTRKSDALASKMKEINTTKKLTRQVPSASVVEGWVAKAKELQPTISH